MAGRDHNTYVLATLSGRKCASARRFAFSPKVRITFLNLLSAVAADLPSHIRRHIDGRDFEKAGHQVLKRRPIE